MNNEYRILNEKQASGECYQTPTKIATTVAFAGDSRLIETHDCLSGTVTFLDHNSKKT